MTIIQYLYLYLYYSYQLPDNVKYDDEVVLLTKSRPLQIVIIREMLVADFGMAAWCPTRLSSDAIDPGLSELLILWKSVSPTVLAVADYTVTTHFVKTPRKLTKIYRKSTHPDNNGRSFLYNQALKSRWRIRRHNFVSKEGSAAA